MSTSNPKDRHEMRAAKDAGRILFPTVTGELHSYSREEPGIVRAERGLPEPSARQMDWKQDQHGQA